MKTKISPALVGFFVLGFLILGIVALLSFGGVNFFSKPQRFVVYFDESIHGLDLGSPVKLRGVRVGRVVDTALNYDSATNEAVVAVTCELNRNMMKDLQGQMVDVSRRDKLDAMIVSGLRAQLGVQGLATGLLFVELDFVDPKEYPAEEVAVRTDLAVVPAMPSAISEFQASLTEITSNLKRVDFPALARDVQGLIADTRRQINGMNLGEVTQEWSKAGTAVARLAESEDVQRVAANLNRAVEQLTVTLAHIDAQVTPTGEQLAAVLAEAKTSMTAFREAAQQARAFVASQSTLGEEATRSLMQLNEAAESVSRLADFLERNPNALLTGKKLK